MLAWRLHMGVLKANQIKLVEQLSTSRHRNELWHKAMLAIWKQGIVAVKSNML